MKTPCRYLLRQILPVDGSFTGPMSDLLVWDGQIAAIGLSGRLSAPEGCLEIQGEGHTLMPAFVDLHVHFRDPGLTHKEDVYTGCAAAEAGGFSHVVPMPNTKPAADCCSLLTAMQQKAAESPVTLCPAGAVTLGQKGETLADFESYAAAGIRAVSEDGRPVENGGLMLKALKKAASLGLVLMDHCEDLSIVQGGRMHLGEVSRRLNVPGMDRASEDAATARDVAFAAAAEVPIHICHVSTKGSVALIREAKARGVRVTCETAPHYLWYTHEKLETMDSNCRMNPPLRTEEDRQALIKGICDGTIDAIATDHAPHTREEKADFFTAPNGVVGLETSFSASYTKLVKTGRCSLSQLVKLMSENPRSILGLSGGRIQPGQPADLVLADLEKQWRVDSSRFFSKGRNTPFEGEFLFGKTMRLFTAKGCR